MSCSQRACILPAQPGSVLCLHHARMFSGEWAFESHGQRLVEMDTAADRQRAVNAEYTRRKRERRRAVHDFEIRLRPKKEK